MFQLEKIFGKGKEAKSFISEITKGLWMQLGLLSVSFRPSGSSASSGMGWIERWLLFFRLAEAPGSAKARMYKVLREVIEDTQHGSESSSNAACSVLQEHLCFLGQPVRACQERWGCGPVEEAA